MLDIDSAYAGGMNLYGYQSSNPNDRLDPSGLFAIGGFGDLMGSTAVRTSLQALEVGSAVAAVVDTFSTIAGGMDWRNALLDAVISAAADRLGGKLFDKALDGAIAGFRAIRNAFSKGGISGIGREALDLGYTGGKRQLISAGLLSARFRDWLQEGAQDVSVYIGYRGGKEVYVGISKDIAQRAGQHGKRFDYVFEIPGASGLTRNQARSIEQVVIERNPHFENLRNEIARGSEYYGEAVTWADNFLGDLGQSGYYAK